MRLRMLPLAAALVAVIPGCPGSEDSADSGEVAEDLRWYSTCGDPACSGYGGPFDGVALCDDIDGGAPAEGDACDEAGASCDPVDYCNALMTCAAEDPKDQTGGCPVSKAEHKRDIDYLSPEELAAVQSELMAMKLATWSYTDESPDATRLGFIIDDQTVGGSGSPAVRPDGERVDLYGYTSMTVAALQSQAAQLEAQAAQVAALEARLKALEAGCATE